MSRNISEGRKASFYIGTVIMVIGLIMFLSVFVSGFMSFGDLDNMDPMENNFGSFAFRGFGGFVLIAIGNMLRGLGAYGLAGSGVILDPKRRRSELEPYSRMAGGMVKDALNEAEVNFGKTEAEKIIMLKCRDCGQLNEEDSKFCQECGEKM